MAGKNRLFTVTLAIGIVCLITGVALLLVMLLYRDQVGIAYPQLPKNMIGASGILLTIMGLIFTIRSTAVQE